VAVEVDLPSLVERVHVSPAAAPRFAEVVREVTSRYGLRYSVVQSALSEPAMY
jgi:hypothetical protein